MASRAARGPPEWLHGANWARQTAACADGPVVLSLSIVIRLKTIVALMLLVLWAPVTSHCLLERVPGLAFLVCAADASGQGDCENDADGCVSVESATYRTEDTQPLVSTFGIKVALLVAILPPDFLPLERETLLAPRNHPPAELQSSWQFAFRTALSPRAPSFAS